MNNKKKYYVVWEGIEPGIYTSWEECSAMVTGFAGAKYKAFPTLEAATAAFRHDSGSLDIFRSIGQHKANTVNYASIPEIKLNAIAVDGACAKNPGPMEYRGVNVSTGKEIFHIGPLDGGTNNIAEYLALIHACALLNKQGDFTTPIYSDSRTAMSWMRNGHSKTTVTPNGKNQAVMELLRRGDLWRSKNRILNPILKWNTEQWGEIPADFGRKN